MNVARRVIVVMEREVSSVDYLALHRLRRVDDQECNEISVPGSSVVPVANPISPFESPHPPDMHDRGGFIDVQFQYVQQAICAVIGHVTDAVAALVARAQQVGFDAGWIEE